MTTYSPPRRGGVARQLNRSWRAGVVSSAGRFRQTSPEASPYRARASRPEASPYRARASRPPLRGGECILLSFSNPEFVLPLHTVLRVAMPPRSHSAHFRRAGVPSKEP